MRAFATCLAILLALGIAACDSSDGSGADDQSPVDAANADGTPDVGGDAGVAPDGDPVGDASPDAAPDAAPDDGAAAVEAGPVDAGDDEEMADGQGADDAGPDLDVAVSEDAVASDADAGAQGCLDPDPAGCTQTGCEDDLVCDPTVGCKPSSCFCHEDTGDWACTKDCGGGTCVPFEGGEKCLGPNPAGCLESGCPDGFLCDQTAGCFPSSCGCDESTGSWVCTEDCGGGSCMPSSGKTCAAADPTACSVAGCPDGEWCDESLEGCSPSSCNCDTQSGLWLCTKDCLPGACVPEVDGQLECKDADPTSCTIIGCPDGFECDVKADVCSPSICDCDGDTGNWKCTADCLPGICVPKKPGFLFCKAPDPTSCDVIGCPVGQVCDTTQGCAPSSCLCDGATGQWVCTKDCVPGMCTDPVDAGCPGANPAGCKESGCPLGFQCELDSGCAPSVCTCDKATGTWGCTQDCAGGVCVAKDGKACQGDEVVTVDGCLDCDKALSLLDEAVAAELWNASAGCQSDKECVLVSSSTECAGGCPVAVRSKWAVKYQDKIGMHSDDYCQDFAQVCGYATPSCLPTVPSCVDGACAAVEL